MKNKIVIEQRDDSLRQRHGGVQHARSYVALVNGVEVEFWGEDLPPGYHSGKYLAQEIYNWVQKWEKALNCRAVFTEKLDRVVYPKLPGMI